MNRLTEKRDSGSWGGKGRGLETDRAQRKNHR